MSITKKLRPLFLALCVCISLSISAYAVDVEGAPANAEPGEATETPESILTAANFPDENFLAALQAIFSDGLTAEAAEQVTALAVSDKGISDLTGIELFPALQYLYADRNQLTKLDISNNPMLVCLSCGVNQLSALDVSKNPALEEIICQNNQIADLDISGNPNLRNLICFGNELETLDLSHNAELQSLACRQNHLAVLDLSANPYLAPDTRKLLSVSPQMIDIGEVGETFDLIEYVPDVDGGNIFNVENATTEGTVFSDYKNGRVIYYFYEVDYVSESDLFCVEVRFSKTEADSSTVPEPPENNGDSPAPDIPPILEDETKDPGSSLPPPENTAPDTPLEPNKPPVSGDTSGGNVPVPPTEENDHNAPYEPPHIIDYPTTKPAPDRTEGTPDESKENGPLSMPFSDVPENSYYYDAVLWAVRQGITVGTGEAAFSPNASCTRAQLVTFLWRAAGSPEPDGGELNFTDVAADSYYCKAVLWAREMGITVGTGNSTFSPDEIVSRAQMVTMLWRMTGAESVSGANLFSDVDTDTYYSRAVLWAGKRGITVGTSATTFSPHIDCSRSQIVTFLYRAFSE